MQDFGGRNITTAPLRNEAKAEWSEAIFDCTGAKGHIIRDLFPPASLVQSVERRSPKPDVEGSSPSGRDL